MRGVSLFLFVCFAAVAASDDSPKTQRIYGGSLTTIDQYPFGVIMLNWQAWLGAFMQTCGGSILTTTAILSAAHCFDGYTPDDFRVRVGSSYSSSGGIVHLVRALINHENYNVPSFLDNDVAIVRTTTAFVYNQFVAPASIAGPNYNVADNQPVWAIGWGVTEIGGSSEQLRHVQVWTINQAVCAARYGNNIITDNMLCSGWLDIDGRGQCSRDSGGPLLHNNVVIGVTSFGSGCGHPAYPSVSARVSRYTAWIVANSA